MLMNLARNAAAYSKGDMCELICTGEDKAFYSFAFRDNGKEWERSIFLICSTVSIVWILVGHARPGYRPRASYRAEHCDCPWRYNNCGEPPRRRTVFSVSNFPRRRTNEIVDFSCGLCGFAAAAAAADLRHIGQKLLAGECIAGKCTYEVLLPTLPDPVEYTVGFRSRAN